MSLALFEKFGEPVSEIKEMGILPIGLAAIHGRLEMVALLKAHGALTGADGQGRTLEDLRLEKLLKIKLITAKINCKLYLFI